MKRHGILAAAIVGAFLLGAGVETARSDTIRVITTIPDLADMVKEIGGDRVKVEALAHGTQNLHEVPARPSFLLKLNKADLFLQLGLDAEHAWVPALLLQARNPRIQPGGKGFVNCSARIRALEVPERVSRRDAADLHPQGNPHYNLDPENGKLMARTVHDGLVRAFPEHEAEFGANLERYLGALDRKIREWEELAKPLRGAKVVTYHRSWSYLAARFGFEIVAEIEPKPGIEPTPNHIAEVVRKMSEEGVRVILRSPSYSMKMARSIADKTGARVVTLPYMVGGVPGADTYIDMIDTIVRTLVDALKD